MRVMALLVAGCLATVSLDAAGYTLVAVALFVAYVGGFVTFAAVRR